MGDLEGSLSHHIPSISADTTIMYIWNDSIRSNSGLTLRDSSSSELGHHVSESPATNSVSSTFDHEVHILEFIESQYNHRETSVIVITSLYFVLFIVGLIGNIAIIYWHVNPKSSYYQRTASNLLVINLCLSDLLVVLFCCPFVAYVKNTTIWKFGEISCTMVHYLQGVAVTSTTLSMTALAFARYTLMQRSDLASMRKFAPLNGIFCLIVWLSSVLLPIPMLFVRKLKRVRLLDYSFSFCLEFWQSNFHRKLFSVITFIIVYLVPCSILIYCHARVSIALYTSSKERGSNLRNSNRKKAFRVRSSHTISSDSTTVDNLEVLTNPDIAVKKKMNINRRHLSRFLMGITVCFVFCWLPYNLTSFYFDLTESNYALNALPFTLLLGHAHSAINPLVYWTLIKTEKEKRLRAIELRSLMVQLSHNSLNERAAQNKNDKAEETERDTNNKSESKMDTTVSSCTSYRYCVRY